MSEYNPLLDKRTSRFHPLSQNRHYPLCFDFDFQLQVDDQIGALKIALS